MGGVFLLCDRRETLGWSFTRQNSLTLVLSRSVRIPDAYCRDNPLPEGIKLPMTSDSRFIFDSFNWRSVAFPQLSSSMIGQTHTAASDSCHTRAGTRTISGYATERNLEKNLIKAWPLIATNIQPMGRISGQPRGCEMRTTNPFITNNIFLFIFKKCIFLSYTRSLSWHLIVEVDPCNPSIQKWYVLCIIIMYIYLFQISWRWPMRLKHIVVIKQIKLVKPLI